MRSAFLLAGLGLTVAAAAQEGDPKALFLSATAGFAAEDYAAAERQFLACRAALGDNATVDYDLALVYLRLETPGRARVYLERCLRLAPRDREAREQLRLLLARLNEAEPPPPTWLHALWEAVGHSLTLTGAFGLAAAANVVAALLVGLWLLKARRWLGWLGLCAALFAALTWLLVGSRLAEELRGRRAIVLAESAAVRGGPGDEFGEIVRLTEGQAVSLVERPRLRLAPDLSISIVHDERGLWCEVRAPSGARGYVRRGLIEPI